VVAVGLPGKTVAAQQMVRLAAPAVVVVITELVAQEIRQVFRHHKEIMVAML